MAAGLLPKPPVPIRAQFVGSGLDLVFRVVFDQQLVNVPPASFYILNWIPQWNNYRGRCTAGWIVGNWVYVRFVNVAPLVATDYISYRKLVPQVVSLDTGLAAEAFVRYPIT